MSEQSTAACDRGQSAVRLIPLTKGRSASVDATDYAALSKWSWYLGSHGYAMRIDPSTRKAVLMHRLLAGASKGQYVDHRNGDKLDNRRANLRICSNAQNAYNQKGRARTSRRKGVCWSKQARKWHSLIMVDGKRVHLGYHADEDAGARAYDEAARRYFGEFARVNFPTEGQ